LFNYENLKESAIDFRYLLNRKYNQKAALELVGNKWNLNRDERHILYRAIFSDEEINKRHQTEVKPEQIQGKTVNIDTYNILITLESILKGLIVIRANDGYIRDISKVSSKYKHSEYTIQAIQMVLKKLRGFLLKEVIFFLDKNISKSGQLAVIIKEEMKHLEMKGDAKPVQCSDKATIEHSGIVISNDRVVLEKTRLHFNLSALILLDLIKDREIKILEFD
jgi:hypothetical protein